MHTLGISLTVPSLHSFGSGYFPSKFRTLSLSPIHQGSGEERKAAEELQYALSIFRGGFSFLNFLIPPGTAQNIDTLEDAVGIKKVLTCHGAIKFFYDPCFVHVDLGSDRPFTQAPSRRRHAYSVEPRYPVHRSKTTSSSKGFHTVRIAPLPPILPLP